MCAAVQYTALFHQTSRRPATPARLSLVAASTAQFFITTIHGASWGVAQDAEEGAAGAAAFSADAAPASTPQPLTFDETVQYVVLQHT